MPRARIALKGVPVKINLEVDCTPEEARRVMGLPDLTPLHERYVAMLGESMERAVRPELLEAMMKEWGPLGESGLAMWRRLFDAGSKAG